jgi:enoyl-CoA hydratase/carnithine racemase
MASFSEISTHPETFLQSLTTLKVELLPKEKVLKVSLNRPKQLNALDEVIFEEIGILFSNIHYLLHIFDFRVILLTGVGKNFSSGLDLKTKFTERLATKKAIKDIDSARKGFITYNKLKQWQNSLTAIENNPLPVVAAVKGYCLGGAMSILSCVDVRLTTKNAKYSIKEVDMALTADIGVLQRLGKQVGRDGIVKKLAFTGELFSGEEAYKYGVVDELYNSEEEMDKAALNLCIKISEKSPIVLWGIKRTINFARDNNIQTSLDHVATLNTALVQTDDMGEAIKSILSKTKPNYPKF